jgi:hypothetical protein
MAKAQQLSRNRWIDEVKRIPDKGIIPYDLVPPMPYPEPPERPKTPKYNPFRNPSRPDPDSYSAILEDLMWISSLDYAGSHLSIHGTIIPPGWPDSWDGLMIALAARHGLITHRLEEHGAVLIGMPALQIMGSVKQMTGEKPTHHEFSAIEARIDITVRA